MKYSRRHVQFESAADVDEDFSFLEDVSAVECLCTIHENQPFQIDIGDVENVEERHPPDQALVGRVHEREAGAHRRIAKMACVRNVVVSPQKVVRMLANAKNEVVVYRNFADEKYRPSVVSSRVFLPSLSTR